MSKFKSVEDEIVRKMPAEKKLKLAFKINNKILKIAKKKTKLQYPNLDLASFSKKLYTNLSLKREFYEDLFNQFLKEELKNWAEKQSTIEIFNEIIKSQN